MKEWLLKRKMTAEKEGRTVPTMTEVLADVTATYCTIWPQLSKLAAIALILPMSTAGMFEKRPCTSLTWISSIIDFEKT